MLHPDEGTIHAWLDGALPPDEAAALESHAAGCAECAAAVAEARGMIAGASRILLALDSVPSGVVPRREAGAAARESVGASPVVRAGSAQRMRRAGEGWWQHPAMRAAAVLLVVVGGVLALSRELGTRREGRVYMQLALEGVIVSAVDEMDYAAMESRSAAPPAAARSRVPAVASAAVAAPVAAPVPAPAAPPQAGDPRPASDVVRTEEGAMLARTEESAMRAPTVESARRAGVAVTGQGAAPQQTAAAELPAEREALRRTEERLRRIERPAAALPLRADDQAIPRDAIGRASTRRSPEGCYRFDRPLGPSASGDRERADPAWHVVWLGVSGSVELPLLPSSRGEAVLGRSSWYSAGDTLFTRIFDGLTGWDLVLLPDGDAYAGTATYLSDAIVRGREPLRVTVRAIRNPCPAPSSP